MPIKLLFLQTLIDFDADWNSNNRLMFAPKLDKSKVRSQKSYAKRYPLGKVLPSHALGEDSTS